MKLRAAPIAILGLAAGALGAAQATTGIARHTAPAPEQLTAAPSDSADETRIEPDQVPLGMRAVAVPLSRTEAAPFAAGGRVDVIAVFEDDGDITNGVMPLARTVVSNAQVLTQPPGSSPAGIDDEHHWVALAVRPGEAERIALGAARGRILLALRGTIDTLPAETVPVTLPALLRMPAPAEANGPPRGVMMRTVVSAVEAEPPTATYHVEAIRATRRTDEAVR